MRKTREVLIKQHKETQVYCICDKCGAEFDTPELYFSVSESEYDGTSYARFDICNHCIKTKLVPFLLSNFGLRLYDPICEEGYDMNTLKQWGYQEE